MFVGFRDARRRVWHNCFIINVWTWRANVWLLVRSVFIFLHILYINFWLHVMQNWVLVLTPFHVGWPRLVQNLISFSIDFNNKSGTVILRYNIVSLLQRFLWKVLMQERSGSILGEIRIRMQIEDARWRFVLPRVGWSGKGLNFPSFNQIWPHIRLKEGKLVFRLLIFLVQIYFFRFCLT